MKKAIVVVSFGTTYQNAAGAIGCIERAVAARHPERDFYRAYTSKIVRRRLLERDGVCIPDPRTLFEQLTELGYEDILVQATHVIAGIEYETLLADAAPFAHVRVCRPLLWREEDYDECVRAVLEMLPEHREDEGVVLMGHGTEHFANPAYTQMERKFRAAGQEHVYVGTVEGFPGLDFVVERLKRTKLKKLYLAPFMIVAGDHAQNDLAGEGDDSWNNTLRAQGYETEVILKGLGESPRIAQLFAAHSCQA
ncbi:MAG: sirohydrochlorin cobaltochelatase [Butyricicoccaceae bacterium]